MDRWAETDRAYDRWAEASSDYDRWADAGGGYDRLDMRRSHLRRPMVKWVGLLIAWVAVAGLLLAFHLTIEIWVVMAALIGFTVYGILRETPRVARPQQRAPAGAFGTLDDVREQFNAPPGWPEPPPGWTPPPGWQPNPAWPPSPPGWQFWRPASRLPFSESPAPTARAWNHRSHRSYRGDTDGDWFTDRWP